MTAELPSLPPHPHVYGNVLDLITDTPLVEIRNLGHDRPRGRVLGKLESLNPAGSIKDRICLSMIELAEREGRLRPGGVVVEPTSGNTGIGLALVCGRKGYRCILTMPESMSLERRQLLKSLGAEVVLTPEEQQMDGAISRAKRIAAETPGAFMPEQFDNRANPDVHYETTAREILHALGNVRFDAFVAAVGTGGTITGVGRALREVYARGTDLGALAWQEECRIIAVEPESCRTISRGERGPSKIQGIGAGFIPKNYDPEMPHEVRTVTDRLAYDTKCALAREEGLLVGISSGANVAIALEVASELGPGSTVVTVLCDTGERYFSLDQHFEN